MTQQSAGTSRSALAHEKIRIGVSSCLLGEAVRFDGGHKQDRYVKGRLSDFFEWVPVCPEIDIGLGTPRESLRLVGKPEAPKILGGKSGIDHTNAMQRYSDKQTAKLATMQLDGYILKRASPSCGMERVRVYDVNGVPTRNGVGVFARALMRELPNLPVEEEGRLQDGPLRENFLERVFCHHRWRQLLAARPTPRALVDFHTAHKFIIMAHSQNGMRELGRMVAAAKPANLAEVLKQYEDRFFQVLRRKATPKTHANVLQHIAGFLKNDIDSAEKVELQQTIDDYRMGYLPLIVPVTLIKHYVNKFDVTYIRGQLYLDPHPKELMLRNHV